jgi:hypothetical protein
MVPSAHRAVGARRRSLPEWISRRRMPVSKWTKVGAMVLAASLAAACGDDGGPGEQIELSNAEVTDLFTAINTIFGEFAGFSVANPGVSFSLAGLAVAIDESFNCPDGGSVDITGNDNSTASTIDFAVTTGFNSCQAEGFTIGGDLDFDGSGSYSETSLSLDMTITGNLSVETDDGRSGTCTWDIEYSLDLTDTTIDYAVSGSICGQNFSYST